MRDHPRSRGVYVSDGFVDFLRVGSSPLARGLRSGRVRRDAHPRIIPARAGFTPPGVAPRTAIADHPRSRGVYDATTGYQSLPTGSSPLARGLPRLGSHRGRQSRIIPARAGFTTRPPVTRACPPDHPRSRGVYGLSMIRWGSRLGSSPLARGLLFDDFILILTERIIPARAGFTAGGPRT